MEKETNKPNDNPKKKGPQSPKVRPSIYWLYGAIAIILLGLQYYNYDSSPKTIDWQKFDQNYLQKHLVKRIIIVKNDFAEIYLNNDSLSKSKDSNLRKLIPKGINSAVNPEPQFTIKFASTDEFIKDIRTSQSQIIEKELAQAKIPVTDTAKRVEMIEKIKQRNYIDLTGDKERKNWEDVLMNFLPLIIIIVVMVLIARRMSGGAGGGQIFNFGKSKASLYDKNTSVTITFENVAGLEEAKVEVMEIVDFLKNPKKYTDLGGKIPRGALLVGPPGTGKTLLAKAVAGEAQVPFFSMSGSDFVEMFVGVGASRVRDLFKQAKDKAPCIVFIDEIDAIGRARGKNAMTGGNDERENTLNQLLTEMDGFTPNTGVIILAATNRADVLDRALLRPGRFDRQIHVELPDLEERKAIFNVHLAPLKYDKENLDIDFLSRQTPGFSGADIANICNEAALIAARKNKSAIEKQDFLDAIDRVIGGLEKRNKIISPKEKKTIAYHESGHAAVSWMLKYAHPLVKVTIVPRGKALGAAWYLPDERQITTKDQLLDEMCATLGGRAAEEVFFGEISTGALNDLERVTKQAYSMVVYFGLNEKIGNISYYDSSGQSEYSFGKPYSEHTAEVIDQEISTLIEMAYNKAKSTLIENKEKVHLLAEQLLSQEVIFREDLEKIFGVRPFDIQVEEEKNLTKKEEPETDSTLPLF